MYGEWYDWVITDHLTVQWYTKVFTQKIKNNSHILDIGVGTGTSLASQFSIIEKKNVHITAIDYDKSYIEYAKEKNFHPNVTYCNCSVYDDLSNLSVNPNNKEKNIDGNVDADTNRKSTNNDNDDTKPNANKFDYIYFSGSISLLPEPSKALQHVSQYLTSEGSIFITQTFQHRNYPLLNRALGLIKPYMYYFVGIDFGKLTYVSDAEKWIEDSPNLENCYIFQN